MSKRFLRPLRRGALVVPLLLAGAAAWAQVTTDPLRLACDAPAPSTVLQPAGAAPAQARGIWFDERTLRWPGAPADGRYRLLHSATGALHVATGEAVRGADWVLPLQPAAAPAPDVAARWRHVGAGATLSLPDLPPARLQALHRGQTVLARTDDRGVVVEATHLQHPGALDRLYAAAESLEDLGATVTRGATRFRVWAPTAQQVALCLYGSDTARSDAVLPMRRDARTGTWQLRRPGALTGRHYAYVVDVHVPGVGRVRNRVTDPYSLSVGNDSKRSVVVDLAAPRFQPPGWPQDRAPQRLQAATDLVVYELHVRDFSIGDTTVRDAWRGKYLAFAEPASDGVKHLRALSAAGVTDVHLLPVFDLASVPETGCTTPSPAGPPDGEQQQAAVAAVASADCYNWGYDPLHYTAPEGSFATRADDGVARVVEFRRMVQALHAMGLRVGMDVVYNHTSASGQKPTSVLDRLVPGYYQRLNADGAVETSTCCDNTATEHRMMGKLMIDSVVVWARDHHVDSFRFDLMGHQPRDVMERLQQRVNEAAGRTVQLIGEGWNFGEIQDGRRFVQASQLSLNGSGIGTFSDRGRDAVRGGSAGDDGAAQIERQGYINGLVTAPNALAPKPADPQALLRAADMVRVGLAGTLGDVRMTTWRDTEVPLAQIDYAGQPAGYASQPSEVVNYVENHDNQTLFDANVFKLPAGTSREDRGRVQTLGSAIVAFSQGIAYFHAGQELLRSKSMDRNSYDSGDWFNRVDWTGRDNFFGSGLPPKQDNARSWPFMKPLLADPSIKPTPADIAFARDAFLDLLRIRASTTLLRLRTADDVKARLRFPNTGSRQVAAVLAGQLDGRGYAGANFTELLYFVNVDPAPQQVVVDTARARPFELHPVHRAPGAADRRPAEQARFDAATGTFTVPPRTALVYVIR